MLFSYNQRLNDSLSLSIICIDIKRIAEDGMM